MEMFWSAPMCGPVPYSAHDIFNVEPKGIAHEISILVISHEASLTYVKGTLILKFFKWKLLKMVKFVKQFVNIQWIARSFRMQRSDPHPIPTWPQGKLHLLFPQLQEHLNKEAPKRDANQASRALSGEKHLTESP